MEIQTESSSGAFPHLMQLGTLESSGDVTANITGATFRGRLSIGAANAVTTRLNIKDSRVETVTGNSSQPVTVNSSCINTGTSASNHEVRVSDCYFQSSGPTIFSGHGSVELQNQWETFVGGTNYSNQRALSDPPEGAVYVVSVVNTGANNYEVTTAGPHNIPQVGIPTSDCVVLMGHALQGASFGGWESNLMTLYTPVWVSDTVFAFDAGQSLPNAAAWNNSHAIVWGGQPNKAIVSTSVSGNDTVINFTPNMGVPTDNVEAPKQITEITQTNPTNVKSANHNYNSGKVITTSTSQVVAGFNATWEVSVSNSEIASFTQGSPVEITTTPDHNFSANENIRITGTDVNTNGPLDGDYTVVAVVSNKKFTVTYNNGGGPTAGNGMVSSNDWFSIPLNNSAGAAGNSGIILVNPVAVGDYVIVTGADQLPPVSSEVLAVDINNDTITVAQQSGGAGAAGGLVYLPPRKSTGQGSRAFGLVNVMSDFNSPSAVPSLMNVTMGQLGSHSSFGGNVLPGIVGEAVLPAALIGGNLNLEQPNSQSPANTNYYLDGYQGVSLYAPQTPPINLYLPYPIQQGQIFYIFNPPGHALAAGDYFATGHGGLQWNSNNIDNTPADLGASPTDGTMWILVSIATGEWETLYKSG